MTRPMHQDAAAVLRRTIVLLLLLLMFSLSSFTLVTAECPDKCWCWIEDVYCSNQELDRIPDRIPPATTLLSLIGNGIRDIESLAHLTELEELRLSSNNISELKNGAFSKLSKLRELFLNENKIENIETGVFNNLTSLEKLHLFDNKIHKLDMEMFKGLTNLDHLYLDYNMISNFPPGIFDSLTSLSVLRLSHNNICELKNGAFSNLSKLQTLDLSSEFMHIFRQLIYNDISELKNGAFSNLSKLQKLFLDNNKIENIETGIFNNLTSLKELHLNNNKIHKLDLEMFKGLANLELLYLNNNMISNIPPGTFDSLTSLSRFGIDYNPFTCDCNILLFANFLKKRYLQRNKFGDDDPSCHFPVEMSGKLLKEITENDFNCTSPDVIVVPENKTVSVVEQLQLSCRAVENPEPSITWAKDDMDQRVQVFQNNTMIISKVERTDGGQYKCVASNSFEAMVNVNEMCPPLESDNSDSLDIECTHNGKYANCSNPSIPDTIAIALCKPLYTAPNGHEEEPLELLCQPNGAWNKELYSCNPSCGKNYTIINGMIMGGETALAATAPWNVGVYKFNSTISDNYDLICGGSIISPNLVVSAAHCFWEQDMASNRRSVNADLYKIAVGKYSRNITIIDNEFTKIINVETVHLNEDFLGQSWFHADDIAIIVLRNRISFSIGVLPVCVDWIGINTIPNGDKGKIVGWGKTEKGIYSPVLLEASLPYIDKITCRKMYTNGFQLYVNKDKFCAGSELGQGVFKGDSGAGLSFLHSNLYYLTGVVSVKDPYTNNSIAVFTEVKHHIQWLRGLYDKHN